MNEKNGLNLILLDIGHTDVMVREDLYEYITKLKDDNQLLKKKLNSTIRTLVLISTDEWLSKDIHNKATECLINLGQIV